MADGPNIGEANRRTEARSPVRVEVRFHGVGEAAKALNSFSINLSSRGLCLRTRGPHAVGDSLALEIDISGDCFKLVGQVAWRREDVIGIRFVEVGVADSQRLKAIATQLGKSVLAG